MKKITIIIAFIGLILILSGLSVMTIIDKKVIQEYNAIIEEKNQLIEQQGREIIKLRTENEALWDNYYMNVSEYNGEYYE